MAVFKNVNLLLRFCSNFYIHPLVSTSFVVIIWWPSWYYCKIWRNVN